MQNEHELIDTGAYHDGREWHYAIRVLECKQGCGYALHVPRRNGRLIFEDKKRISYEREIQTAIDDGLPEHDFDAFIALCQKHVRAHHWASVPWFRITAIDTTPK